MATFLSSDWHCGHTKILTLGVGRPFGTIAAMEDRIVANLNAVAGSDDTLYYLGDGACGVGPDKLNYIRAFRGRLNVGTIHWIKGNHDPSVTRMQELVRDGVLASVQLMIEAKIDGKELVCAHYPLEHWGYESNRVWMIHGHTHLPPSKVKTPLRLRLDVGVDGHEYKPWSMDEIREAMKGPWHAPEHHA